GDRGSADQPSPSVQLTSAIVMEDSVLDAFHQFCQIVIEIEMISGKHPDGEFLGRTVAPGRRVLVGHDDVVIPDERVDRARHRYLWWARITGDGTDALQRWQ